MRPVFLGQEQYIPFTGKIGKDCTCRDSQTVFSLLLRNTASTERRGRQLSPSMVGIVISALTAPRRRIEFDRLVAEWLAGGRHLSASGRDDFTVVELCAAFWRQAKGYYVKDGAPTSTLDEIKRASAAWRNSTSPPWSTRRTWMSTRRVRRLPLECRPDGWCADCAHRSHPTIRDRPPPGQPNRIEASCWTARSDGIPP